MKLCVNYLEELKLLFEEENLDFIDYIKLYSINGDLSPFDWCRSKKTVMFHGFIGETGSNIADKNFFENRNIEMQRLYFNASNTPYISMHINAREEPIPAEEEAIDVIKNNVERLKKEFGKDIILENVPAYDDREKFNFYASPEFITRVIEETKCGFLFDIGHARAAAEVLKIPFNEYVRRLPMDKIREIHLAGCMRDEENRLVPNHSKMNEEDYIFLENLLKESKTLEVVTLEYGTVRPIRDCPTVSYGMINKKAKKEVLEQLLKLKDMLNK